MKLKPLAAALATAALATVAHADSNVTIKIISFNDFHGNLYSPGTFGVPMQMINDGIGLLLGLAPFAALVALVLAGLALRNQGSALQNGRFGLWMFWAAVMLTTTERNRSRSVRRTRRESIRSAPPVSRPVIRWTMVITTLSVSPHHWIFDPKPEHKRHQGAAIEKSIRRDCCANLDNA